MAGRTRGGDAARTGPFRPDPRADSPTWFRVAGPLTAGRWRGRMFGRRDPENKPEVVLAVGAGDGGAPRFRGGVARRGGVRPGPAAAEGEGADGGGLAGRAARHL